MNTLLLTPDTDPHAIATAASLLRRGEVVGIPTETVYGLAADAAMSMRSTVSLRRKAVRRTIR